jgi:hypothetical protein
MIFIEKAIRSGDADLISKADTLKTDIAIQKEKLRVAQSNQSRYLDQQRGSQENYQAYQQPQEQQVKPTSEALSWHDQNKWYGDSESEENLQATQFAYFTHFNLINEGFEPDSEEYYNELDTRVFRIYPTLKGSSVAEKKEVDPLCKESLPPAPLDGNKHRAASVVLSSLNLNFSASVV